MVVCQSVGLIGLEFESLEHYTLSHCNINKTNIYWTHYFCTPDKEISVYLRFWPGIEILIYAWLPDPVFKTSSVPFNIDCKRCHVPLRNFVFKRTHHNGFKEFYFKMVDDMIVAFFKVKVLKIKPCRIKKYKKKNPSCV